MIRIVDMRDATSGDHAFAIYDTVISRFVDIDGCTDWDGSEEFSEAIAVVSRTSPVWRGMNNLELLSRVLGLLPKWAVTPCTCAEECSYSDQP